MNDKKTIGVVDKGPDDGGSLYPTDTAAGMSMRDYFASDQTAALLGGLFGGFIPKTEMDSDNKLAEARRLIPMLVDLGYKAADAMIERRKQ